MPDFDCHWTVGFDMNMVSIKINFGVNIFFVSAILLVLRTAYKFAVDMLVLVARA